jgi:HAD superfamily hydrolase (TIGR01509 family)
MSRYKVTEDRKIFMKKGKKYLLDVFSQQLDYMPGFLDLINRISHIKKGLVTATNKEMYRWVDDKLKVSSHFNSIIYGGMTKNNKPHPEPYLTMMENLSVIPSRCVVVEDSVHGIASGLSAGAKVIALSGSVESCELVKANAVVDHLDDINETLLISLFE